MSKYNNILIKHIFVVLAVSGYAVTLPMAFFTKPAEKFARNFELELQKLNALITVAIDQASRSQELPSDLTTQLSSHLGVLFSIVYKDVPVSYADKPLAPEWHERLLVVIEQVSSTVDRLLVQLLQLMGNQSQYQKSIYLIELFQKRELAYFYTLCSRKAKGSYLPEKVHKQALSVVQKHANDLFSQEIKIRLQQIEEATHSLISNQRNFNELAAKNGPDFIDRFTRALEGVDQSFIVFNDALAALLQRKDPFFYFKTGQDIKGKFKDDPVLAYSYLGFKKEEAVLMPVERIRGEVEKRWKAAVHGTPDFNKVRELRNVFGAKIAKENYDLYLLGPTACNQFVLNEQQGQMVEQASIKLIEYQQEIFSIKSEFTLLAKITALVAWHVNQITEKNQKIIELKNKLLISSSVAGSWVTQPQKYAKQIAVFKDTYEELWSLRNQTLYILDELLQREGQGQYDLLAKEYSKKEYQGKNFYELLNISRSAPRREIFKKLTESDLRATLGEGAFRSISLAFATDAGRENYDAFLEGKEIFDQIKLSQTVKDTLENYSRDLKMNLPVQLDESLGEIIKFIKQQSR